MAKVLEKIGATVWARAVMYTVVVQALILYRIKSCVVMEAMVKVL